MIARLSFLAGTVFALAVAVFPAAAGTLRERLGAAVAADLPAGVRVLRDLAYGDDPDQRFDVYAPASAAAAPVILLAHGGGWAIGDKGHRSVVANKVARWLPRGVIVVSANYRMLPKAGPLEQARDLARALAAVQAGAAGWGGDGRRIVLMGHSAGAHLAALLAASPTLASDASAHPWLGTVALDSAAFDLVDLMQRRHLPLYDRAFGPDPQAWQAASPLQRLAAGRPPMLAVCSTQRFASCRQAERFAARARQPGNRAEVLPANLSHSEINERLGTAGDYTAAVESFLAGLDPAFAQAPPR